MPKLKGLRNILVMRNGDALVGRCLDKTFRVRTNFGELEFPTKKIVHIHFSGVPGYPKDELQIITGDKVRGDVKPVRLTFVLEANSQTLLVPKDQIHTAIFLDTVTP